jgi:hypothetical protein
MPPVYVESVVVPSIGRYELEAPTWWHCFVGGLVGGALQWGGFLTMMNSRDTSWFWFTCTCLSYALNIYSNKSCNTWSIVQRTVNCSSFQYLDRRLRQYRRS